MQDFDFYVGGIEDRILEVLKAGMPGVKNFVSYSGELDGESLKKAISSLIPKFPLVLVSYTNGVDRRVPATARTKDAPLHFTHYCNFAVMCATNDARGERARRRGLKTGGAPKIGCYQMLSKVRELLGGVWLDTTQDEDDLIVPLARLPLTTEPLIPVANEFIVRLKNLTAYAVIFETSFNFQTPDRRTSGTPVNNLAVEVSKQNSSALPPKAAGVKQ